MGGVVGGILGLAVVAAAIWFFLRRRKSQQANTAIHEPFLPPASGPAVTYMHEADGAERPFERPGNEGVGTKEPVEKFGNESYEMDGRQAPGQGHGPYEVAS